MKFKSNLKQLSNALDQCARVVGRGPSVILQSVKITVLGDRVTLEASNALQTIRIKLSCTDSDDGSVCVDAKTAAAHANVLSGETAVLDASGDHAILSSGSRKFKLNSYDADDYPSLPTPSGDTVTMTTESMLRLMKGASFCVSDNAERPVISNALLQSSPDAARMVGTDGVAMAICSIGDISEPTELLIPSQALKVLRQLAAEGDELSIARSAFEIFFTVGNSTLSTKPTSDKFVPWEQVIPSQSSTTILVDRVALLESVSALSTATLDNIIGIKLTVSSGDLVLETDTGYASDKLELKQSAEATAEPVCLSWRLLKDALSALESEVVSVGLSGALDPVVVKPIEDPNGYESLSVIMPIRR